MLAYTITQKTFVPYIELTVEKGKPGLVLSAPDNIVLDADKELFPLIPCSKIGTTYKRSPRPLLHNEIKCDKCGEQLIRSFRGQEGLYIYDHPAVGGHMQEKVIVDRVELVNFQLTTYISPRLTMLDSAFIHLKGLPFRDLESTHLVSGFVHSSPTRFKIPDLMCPSKMNSSTGILGFSRRKDSISDTYWFFNAAITMQPNSLFGICGENTFPDKLIVWNGSSLHVLDTTQKEI